MGQGMGGPLLTSMTYLEVAMGTAQNPSSQGRTSIGNACNGERERDDY